MHVPFDIVVAADKRLGIGKAGAIPWRLPSDVAFFKTLTTTARPGQINAVIMGRITWESLPPRYRPLPGRLNVVVSTGAPAVSMAMPAGVRVEPSIESALAGLGRETSPPIDQVFVIGGTQTYQAALATGACRAIYITHVDSDFDCDRFFPRFDDHFALDEVIAEGTDSGLGYRIERWRPLAPAPMPAPVPGDAHDAP